MVHWFQHTAARRRLRSHHQFLRVSIPVSTHSRAEAAADTEIKVNIGTVVSTHSRAEAAARKQSNYQSYKCVSTHSRAEAAAQIREAVKGYPIVSTHSRAEAAAKICNSIEFKWTVSTHSRAEAAAFYLMGCHHKFYGFNTQPHEGGCTHPQYPAPANARVSTHSRTKAAAEVARRQIVWQSKFQHTAARRRLPTGRAIMLYATPVSTHSRTKAAAYRTGNNALRHPGFNTQPHEGGCT